MPVRLARVLFAVLAVGCAGAARAARVDGSVFLMPIDSTFRSVGEARFLDDLGRVSSAALSGSHNVNGPSSFQSPVQGDGKYSYILEGPADPGACYGTSLHVIADPPLPFTRQEATWTGDTRCAPSPPAGGGGGGGSPGPGDGGGFAEDLPCFPNVDCSPIVINFEDGDYRLTGANAPVRFRMNPRGDPILMGWTAAGADEAFLWLDRNHNGTVTSGAELFGNFTRLSNGRMAKNGFEALRELDANNDGVIDERDPIWQRLLLWRDLNHNGISEPWEIAPVAGSGVVAIDLNDHQTGKHDVWGNAFRYESLVSMQKRSGRGVRTRPLYDIFFVPIDE
jgi:hypothetical protein